MGFSLPILANIALAKQYLSSAIASDLVQKKTGCIECTQSTDCLKGLMFSLDYKVSKDSYDSTAKLLYKRVMKIVGGLDIADIVVYFGRWDGATLPTEAQVLASLTSIVIDDSADYEIPFVGGVGYYYFAEPIDQPVKNSYVDLYNLEEGSIGLVSDLFDAGVVMGQIRLYPNRYATNLSNDYLIKSI